MTVKKDERNGKWKYEGKKKLKNGKYKSYFKTGFKTKKAAQKAEQIFLDNYSDVELTLDDVVQIYISSVTNVKESTISTKISKYDSQIKSRLGDMKVVEITSKDIEEMQLELIAKGYKESYVESVRIALSGILTFAKDKGFVKDNECKKVHKYKDPNKVEEDFTNYWSKEQFDEFVKHLNKDKDVLLFTFLFQTGVRIGECLALTWNDVDFIRKKVRINKTTSRRTSIRKTVLTSPKTKRSYRTIDIPDTLSERLEKLYSVDSMYDGFTDDWFVFGSFKPITEVSIRYRKNIAIKEAGLPYITLHGFRHSHASMLIKKGFPDIFIADRLGHTIDMLHNIYAHIYDDMRNELQQELNEMF